MFASVCASVCYLQFLFLVFVGQSSSCVCPWREDELKVLLFLLSGQQDVSELLTHSELTDTWYQVFIESTMKDEADLSDINVI